MESLATTVSGIFRRASFVWTQCTGLQLVDWFTPSNWSTLDGNDLDLAASGPMLIPGTSLLAGGGKEGVLYILDTANLGKLVANDTQIVQKIVANGRIMGGPVFWNRPAAAGGALLYHSAGNDVPAGVFVRWSAHQC